MRTELMDVYNTLIANPKDKDMHRHYRRTLDRIAPQIVIDEMIGRDELIVRVKKLEDALRFILDECDWEPTAHEFGGDARIGIVAREALSLITNK